MHCKEHGWTHTAVGRKMWTVEAWVCVCVGGGMEKLKDKGMGVRDPGVPRRGHSLSLNE